MNDGYTFLHVEVLIEQKILRFEISVHHIVSVAVFDAGYDLLEEPSGVVFFQLEKSIFLFA